MHWEIDGEYTDGTIIHEQREYDYSKGESEQEYELECELIEDNSYSFGECINYSVNLILD